MPSHHPLIKAISPFEGWVDEAFLVDCFGCLFSKAFAREHHHPELFQSIVQKDASREGSVYIKTSLPSFGEEYFEWIDLLEAVDTAQHSFVMLELGAGFGRWGVRGYKAAQRKGLSPKILLAEADPIHLVDLKQFLLDNAIPESDVTVVEAAVSNKMGQCYFHVEPLEKNEAFPTPRDMYGQALCEEQHAVKEPCAPHEGYYGQETVTTTIGWKAIPVPTVTMNFVLSFYDHIDLVDMDIQGEEFIAVEHGINALNKKVKRLHISTHKPEIEIDLRNLLNSQGWICLRDFSTTSENDTPYGRFKFVDGRQTWVNGRFQ